MASSTTLKQVPSSDERRTLSLENSFIVLKEWNPEDDSSSNSRLSITTDNGMRPRVAAEQSKEIIDFEYVFAIGGDGTLLLLLVRVADQQVNPAPRHPRQTAGTQTNFASFV